MRGPIGRLLGALWATTALASLACTSNDKSDGLVIGIADWLYPASTMTDVVSWSVQFAQVLVLSEWEHPPPQEVLDRNEGYIGRKARVRVERTLWTAPSAKLVAPEEFELFVVGWVLSQGRKSRFAVQDSPRLEVGGRYVMPLTTFPIFALPPPVEAGVRSTTPPMPPVGFGWSPLSGDIPFAVPGDPVATADVTARGNSPLAKQLAAMTDEEIVKALQSAPIDPQIVPFLDLSPWERWLALRNRSQPDAGAGN